MSNNRETGGYGEKLAEKYLINKGYMIRTRNFRCIIGEIDLVVYKDRVIVFVEVKYRRDLSMGYPAESVTPYKQRKIRRAAEYYISKHNIRNTDLRIDVIQIIDDGADPMIEHIENAF